MVNVQYNFGYMKSDGENIMFGFFFAEKSEEEQAYHIHIHNTTGIIVLTKI